MESVALGIFGLGLGLTRVFGRKAKFFTMSSKDKVLLLISLMVVIPCFTLIAFGRNTPECFGLIGLVVGHYFGRETGKSETTDRR